VRLEGLAAPGGICVSGTVRDHIGDRLPYAFEDMGEQSVKNIARPVRAYAWHPGGTAGWPTASGLSSLSSSPPVAAPRLSIVVLPFANLSNDPEQEYFADGITDDLTTDLSRISASFVIARNTAFTYKGKPVDVKQIGRELGVRYVLEGSVRRTGNQVRINIQLIDAETGAHLWADRFDTDRANLAEAQDEITGRLKRTLNLEIIEAAARRIEQERAADPDACDLIMRGWAQWYRPSSFATRQGAQQAFEQALEMDPRSVDAQIGLAQVLIANLADGWSSSLLEDSMRAEQLILEALERDINNSMAHHAMGQLRLLQNRITDARIEFEAAIQIDPNNARAFFQLGRTLQLLGDQETAISHVEKAIRLNPRDPNVAGLYQTLGACHLLLGHVNQALDLLRKARAANPRLYYTHFWLAGALGLWGDLDEAKTVLAEGIKLKPEVNSLARLRSYMPWITNPQHWALRDKTLNVGLRRAGFPDE
jgi:TolB-like protein/Tfp pilus assembly protein PilF